MGAKGIVFAIEEFSTFDGPGIRSTVFLKGCPLRCSWCHNPEGQNGKQQILRNPNGCIKCGKCERIALELTGKKALIPESIPVCPRGLIRLSGIQYTPEQLYERLIRNESFYAKTGGGITFSGGEPLAQPEFLQETLKLFRKKINCCVQTSGYAPTETFREIMKLSDLFLFDLKVMDPEASRKYVGANNHLILLNFEQLVDSGVPFTVRIPLIPQVTATETNLRQIKDLLKFYGISYVEALPYNKLAGGKYPLCGRTYQPDFDPQAECYDPVQLFQKSNIDLKVL